MGKGATARKTMTLELFEDNFDADENTVDGPCVRSRFPEKWEIQQHRDTMKQHYVEERAEKPPEDGVRYANVKTPEVAVDQMLTVCNHVVEKVSEAIANRVSKYDGRSAGGAISDRWLCFRATGLCDAEEFPELDDDEEADSEEL